MDTLITPGMPAPAFSLPDLYAKSHSLGQYSGKIVLINFWSAECPWSARTDTTLLAHYKTWGEEVAWLSIASNTNEPVQLLTQTAQERHLPLVLLDINHRVADLYHAQTTPHCFLIDAVGIVCYQGAFDDVTLSKRTPTQDYLVSAIEALRQGRLPNPAQTISYGCTIVRFTV